jgi:hypothetical protein
MKPNAVVCYTTNNRYMEWGKDALATFLLHNPEFDGWLVVSSRPFSYLQVPSASFKIMAKGFQRLTTLDSDSITTGKYERLLWDADILACHNAPGIFEPLTCQNICAGRKAYNVDIKDNQHLNNHLFTVTKLEVLEEITELCHDNPLQIESDQVYCNIVAHSGNHALRWMDTVGVVYNEIGRDDLLGGNVISATPPQGEGELLFTSTDHRQVCGIHWAGGEGNSNKRNLEALPPLVSETVTKSLKASAGVFYNIVEYSDL